jgi:glyoxylase I family protein
MAAVPRDSSADSQAKLDERQRLKDIREKRQASIPIMRLHHSALRTDDMEATRQFYEDILGLPLVHTMKMAVDPTTGKATPFLHCFFEMADGSMIAFFYVPSREKAPITPQDAFDYHFAIKVASFDQLIAIKKRFDERNYPTAGINHGFCYSLYTRDPNKTLIEIVADPEEELEINEGYAANAKKDWLSWKSGDFSSNEDDHSSVEYPLPMSSVEEMSRVLPAKRD